MYQTTIMNNLRSKYYKDDIIDKIEPFYLTLMLYKNFDQFMKDKDARKILLKNTLQGINDLRFVVSENVSYYTLSNFGKIDLDRYIEISKEILEAIVDNGWKSNIVMRSVTIMTNCNMTRKVLYNHNLVILGGDKDNAYNKDMYEKMLKEYLITLDPKYTRYLVDDII